jgi:hypothetical protein
LTGDLLSRAFDDFKLALGVDIEDVHWRGSYIDLSNRSATPAAIAERFRIEFWSNNGGFPGSPIRTFDVPVEFVTERNVTFQLLGNLTLGVYEYSFDFSSVPLTIEANTTYWLSIQAVALSPFSTVGEEGWFWNNGTGGNGTSIIMDQQNTSEQNFSLNFALTGDLTPVTPIPEPGTISIFLMSVLGLLGFSWMKRNRNHAV